MNYLVIERQERQVNIPKWKQYTHLDVGMWKLGGEGAESLFKTSILFVPRPLTATKSPRA